MKSAVVHVTPELAPMVGGIADYAAILSNVLAKRGVPQCHLVAGYGASIQQVRIRDQFPNAEVLQVTSPEQLLHGLRAFDAKTVLLHYSGYGYARRGAPLWLVRGLNHWKNRRRQHRLVVMFHETWAFGPVWRSSFWSSRVQRWCVRRIAGLADAVVTSNGFYGSRLEPFLRDTMSVRVEPIFSNVGEPNEVPPVDVREPACVLFGRGGNRRRTYQRFRPYLGRLSELGITRILEIGSEAEATKGLEWPFPVDRFGALPAAKVSAVMLGARYGLFECPLHLVGKSTVLAALAAHAVVPLHPDGEGSFDGLAFDRAAISLANVPPPWKRDHVLLTVAATIRDWYREHDIQRQVSRTWLPILVR